jgi:hypothetical protein
MDKKRKNPKITDELSESSQAIKKLVMSKLAEIGVNKVTIEYSGGGDDGQIDDIVLDDEALDAAGVNLKLESVMVRAAIPRTEYTNGQMRRVDTERDTHLKDVIEELFYLVLSEVDAVDWCNDEGGRGSMVFNVGDSTIEVHHQYYEQVSHDQEFVV